MGNVRRLVQIASLIAVAFTGTACGKISIPANLVMDPTAENTMSVDVFGTPLTLPLQGGLSTQVSIDTRSLLSPSGITTTIKASSVEIAGASAKFLGLETGTLCARESASDPTVATAHIKLFGQSLADFHLATEATSTLIASLIPGGLLSLVQDIDDMPLTLDFKKLLKLDLSGLRTEASLGGTLPADAGILAGRPYNITITMIGSLKKATGPLLDECRPFYDAN